MRLDPTIDTSSLSSAALFNSVFARALAEPNASLVLLTDPHLMFLPDLLSSASLLSSRFPLWAISGGVRVTPDVPFAQEAVREAVQGALRTGGKRSVIDGRRVAQYVADIGVMDVRGGAGGYVLWSQEGLREAAKARQMRESEGKKSATKGGSPEEPAVSLVGEPMPPFVSGQWLPWAWLLQQMIEKSRESRRVAREREGEGEGDDGLYVVDGSETVHAVAVRREKDCEVEEGGRGEGEGLGWDSGCGASGTEAWHEGLNDHLLMRWAGEQGRRRERARGGVEGRAGVLRSPGDGCAGHAAAEAGSVPWQGGTEAQPPNR